jgi:hypothetical protein
MRDLLSKVMTGSMVAGAALLVAACGGNDEVANNTVVENLEVDMGNDTTVLDATNGTDAMNMSTDATAVDANAAAPAATDNATNGM